MRQLRRWYEQFRSSYPVRTEMVRSGITWGLDVIGLQAFEHSLMSSHHRAENPEDKYKDFKIDWTMAGFASFCGFALFGPAGHYWNEHLDRLLLRRYLPRSIKFRSSKMAVDCLATGALCLGLLYTYSETDKERLKDSMKMYIPGLVLGTSPQKKIEDQKSKDGSET